MNRYGISEVWEIIDQEVGLTGEIHQTQVNRWIGERHMHDTGRSLGSGGPVEYKEKDIRRAIAYLRLKRVTGATTGKVGSDVARRMRQVASWHTDGYVVAYLENGKDSVVVEHSEHGRDITAFLEGHNDTPFIVIPCTVESFNQNMS